MPADPNTGRAEARRLLRELREEELAYVSEDQARQQQRSQRRADRLAAIEQAVADVGEQQPLAPVTGLAVELASDTSVRLTWTDPPDSVDAYELEGMPGLLASDASTHVLASLPKGTFTPPRIRRIGTEANGPWASFPAIDVPGPDIVVDPEPTDYARAIPAGAQTVAADVNLSTLAPGAYVMSNGARADLMGLRPGVRLWCANRLGVRVNTPKGKRVAELLNVEIGGFDVYGGGLKEKLNDKQGIAVGDNSRVCWIRYTESLGVAVAFGIGSDPGENVGVYSSEFYNCGSASIGGKGQDAEVFDNLCVDGNKTVRDADGAGMGKFNRCRNIRIRRNRVVNGWHTLIWFDIRNSGTEVTDNVLDGCARVGKSYEGRGIFHEIGNRPTDMLPHLIARNAIKNLYGPAIGVEETQNVTVQDNVIWRGLGPEAAELHLRQDDRTSSDDGAHKIWLLRNLKVLGNRRGEEGQSEILATRSNSGQKFTPKTLVDAWGCQFQPEVRFAF